MGSRNLKRTKKLHSENPNCYWCEKETFFNSENGVQKHDTATLDHVYSKFQTAIRIFENPTVLVCYECNQFRNDQEQQANVIEKYQDRSVFYRKVKFINGKRKLKFIMN